MSYKPISGPFTMADIRAANKAAGFHFFDRDTMRFFRSRVVRVRPRYVDQWVYFITSEQAPDASTPRYTVRKFDPGTGRVETFGEFMEHCFTNDAKEAIAKQLEVELAAWKAKP